MYNAYTYVFLNILKKMKKILVYQPQPWTGQPEAIKTKD